MLQKGASAKAATAAGNTPLHSAAACDFRLSFDPRAARTVKVRAWGGCRGARRLRAQPAPLLLPLLPGASAARRTRPARPCGPVPAVAARCCWRAAPTPRRAIRRAARRWSARRGGPSSASRRPRTSATAQRWAPLGGSRAPERGGLGLGHAACKPPLVLRMRLPARQRLPPSQRDASPPPPCNPPADVRRAAGRRQRRAGRGDQGARPAAGVAQGGVPARARRVLPLSMGVSRRPGVIGGRGCAGFGPGDLLHVGARSTAGGHAPASALARAAA
jgi:hypothetical protein